MQSAAQQKRGISYHRVLCLVVGLDQAQAVLLAEVLQVLDLLEFKCLIMIVSQLG